VMTRWHARAVPAGTEWLRGYLGGGRDLSRRQRIGHALVLATTLGCVAMVLVNFVVAPLIGHFTGRFEDFGFLLDGGRAANVGADPYAPFIARAPTTQVIHLGFDYLPIIAVLMRSLAGLPHHVAATLWLWFILGCTTVALIIGARVTLPSTWPRAAIGFCLIVLFPATTYNLWHGQMNAVVLLTLAIALRAWIRGDEITCGIALGLGGIAKVAPLALLLLLLRRRWWRGFLAGTATAVASLLASGLFLGFNRVTEWFTGVLPFLGRIDGWYLNEGLGGLISRIFDHNVVRLDPALPALQATVTLLSAACVLAAAWLVRGGEASAERRSLEFGTAILAMVLAGAVTWWSDYGSLALTVLVLLGLAAKGFVSRRVLVAGTVFAVVAGVGASVFFGYFGQGWIPSTYDTPWWIPALQIDSIPGYTAVILLVTLLIALARDSTMSAPQRHDVRGVT
jgi:hypothetical protein